MIERHLVQRCELIKAVQNKFGDYEYNTESELKCRFREISTVVKTGRGEINDSDAMLWVLPDSSVVKGSLIKFENVIYQIERITKARKLGSNHVEFIKCDLRISKYVGES